MKKKGNISKRERNVIVFLTYKNTNRSVYILHTVARRLAVSEQR